MLLRQRPPTANSTNQKIADAVLTSTTPSSLSLNHYRSLGSGRLDENGKVTLFAPTILVKNKDCDATASFGSSDEEESLASTLSTEEVRLAFSERDIYGQRHPMETDALIESRLEEFDDAVQDLLSSVQDGPTSSTSRYYAMQQAHLKCPEELLNDAFKLLFLRCEVFDVQRAAKRYAKYWEKRLDLFGPDRAFAKLTLASLSEEERIPLRTGALQILESSPSSSSSDNGRNMLYFDPSKLAPGTHSREAGCRAFWYLLHALLEGDDRVQRRGLVAVCYCANFSNRNRDPTFTKLCLNSMQGCLPIRLSGFHGCHLPPMYKWVARIVLLLLGERLRKRVVQHTGENVTETLQAVYGIGSLPTDLGGTLHMNVNAWLEDRLDKGL